MGASVEGYSLRARAPPATAWESRRTAGPVGSRTAESDRAERTVCDHGRLRSGQDPTGGARIHRPARCDYWNISLFKNFVFGEARATNLQFRAEFFNIWNHPQWVGDTLNGGISTNYGASNFGAITSAYDARSIQFGLKLLF